MKEIVGTKFNVCPKCGGDYSGGFYDYDLYNDEVYEFYNCPECESRVVERYVFADTCVYEEE